MDELRLLIEETQRLHHLAYRQYKTQVEELCVRKASEDEVAHCLDGLLGFASDEKILDLYKKVCRTFLVRYPDTISFYITAYQEMWDESEGSDEGIP